MKVDKYKFGNNFVYEIENPTDEMFEMLTSKLSINASVLKEICFDYKKLLIGMGNLNKFNDLLALFDLCMAKEIILHTSKFNKNELLIILDEIKKVKPDIKIIHINSDTDFNVDFDVEIYCPIIRKD